MGPEETAALRQLVDRYADAVDRRDAEALADLFCRDAVVTVQSDSGPVENEWRGSEVVRLLDQLAAYEGTFHHIGGCVFDEAGSGSTGRVQCQAHHYDRTRNGPVDLVMMIHYHDRYAREAGSWRIAERRVAIEWTELHPAHPKRRARS